MLNLGVLGKRFNIEIVNTMKRLCGLMTIVAVVGLSSCGNKTDQLQNRVDSLEKALNASHSDYRHLSEALNVISSGLDSIAMQETALFNSDKESPAPNQQKIKEDLSRFKETLEMQRKRISQLEAQLNGKNDEAMRLQRIIIALKAQLVEKESQVARMQEELNSKSMTIEELRQRMDGLMQESKLQQQIITSQSQVMEMQDRKLYEGYVCIGTKDELKKSGLLKGGFLKKSKVDMSSLDVSKFKTIDIRLTTEIEINSKDAEVLTQMPADSYTLKRTGKKSVLSITDTERFWAVSKYLVIQTD